MARTELVRVLTISGSLRRSSSNSALLAAAAALAPACVEVSAYDDLATLPPFNPDIGDDTPPAAVVAFRAALAGSDAVLISTPEYAHGVPGVLKNALDWVVGSGELIDKPVAVMNASPRAFHAWTSLVETLTVMSARLLRDASITIALQGSGLDARGIAAHAALAAPITAALDALAGVAREGRG